MKILLLTDRFLPHAGGSRVYYYNVYKRLAAQCGDHVTILTKNVPGSKAFDELEQTPAFQISRSLEPAGNWKYHQVEKLFLPLLKTVATVRKTRPEIIHVGDLFPQGLIALVLKKVFGLPYLVYCHGEEITQMDRARFEPRIRDFIYRNADRVIAASAFARNNLLRIGVPDGQITTITPGVELSRFDGEKGRDRIRQRFGLGNRPLILTVARLVPRKGHADTLKALALLRRSIPDIHYLIVGTGPEEAALREMTQSLGIASLVTFAGYVIDAELPDYYAACDVLAMPNYEEASTGDIEGFGMVFLEANAAGKPAIGGRSGGAEEAIVDGRTGFLCEPRDVPQLERLLRDLLCSPALRRQMGEAGRTRVRDEFQWESRAAAIHAASCRILGHSQSGEPVHS